MPIPLTVSTAWAARGPHGPAGTLERLSSVSATGVELEYRLRERDFHPLVAALRSEGLPIRALHNFCPHPADHDALEPSGDLFRLSSLDERERSLAVAYTRRTIRHAAELGAGAVVLHLGSIDGAEPATLRAAVERWGPLSESTRRVLRRWMALRAWRARPHLEAVARALEPLAEEAAAHGVRLGLETRVHLHELPDPDELALLLARFDGAVGYWHDTGHAEIRARYGLAGPHAWLDRFGHALVGVHLSDARGWRDHLAPGRGTVDFGAIARHLSGPSVIASLEIDPDEPPSVVRRGLWPLARAGLLDLAPAPAG